MKEKKNIPKSKLRQAREQRGWTQKALADNICLPDTRLLRRWEGGEVVPSLRYRVRLCEIFEMSAEDLGLLPANDVETTEIEEQSSEQLAHHLPATTAASTPPPVVTPNYAHNLRNRLKLLAKVNTFWINEVLEQSLSGNAPLALELQIQPDAVTNPWNQIIDRPQQSVRLLPPNTLIHQVYDSACGELLILGAPGAGKTTLLLELTRNLLQRAFADETYPMPVVFNLSSWSTKNQPLAAWLVEELSDKYQIPQQVGRAWVEGDRLLPLLDGLDEVNPALRELCVDAITTYRKEHGLVPLVVCSRKDEYLKLSARLLLQQAICIRPLTQQQIDAYLSSEGEWSERLQATLHADKSLQQLVTTPLMLNVLTTAYQGQSVESLQGEKEALEERRRRVFATYVERMLKRRKPERRYTTQQSRRWLAYLARQMHQHRQAEFSPERMQFDWLPDKRLQQICAGLVMGLEAGLVCGILAGLMTLVLRDTTISELIVLLCLVMLVALIVGITGTLADGVLRRASRKTLMGLIVGTLLGGGMIWASSSFSWSSGIPIGRSLGLVIILTFHLLGIRHVEIQEKETAIWRCLKTYISQLPRPIKIMYICTGILMGLLIWLLPGLRQEIITLLFFGLCSFLNVSLLDKFLSERLETYLFVRPNQSIRRSAYYALWNGLAGGVLNWLVLIAIGLGIKGVFPFLTIKLDFIVIGGLIISLLMMLLMSLHKGGEAYIKHLLLRLMLWLAGRVPWNYARFLDSAAERILLHKTASGYMFVHQMLLEYFALLDDI